jgi:hypothetical protein
MTEPTTELSNHSYRTRNYMTQSFTRCALLGITVALFSVTYGPAAVSAQEPGSPTGQAARPDAREFINQMSIAGMAEVQVGMLASERGTDPDVKAFGQIMVKDPLGKQNLACGSTAPGTRAINRGGAKVITS